MNQSLPAPSLQKTTVFFELFSKTHGPDNNVSPMSIFDGNVLCIMEVAECRGIERVTVAALWKSAEIVAGSLQHFGNIMI